MLCFIKKNILFAVLACVVAGQMAGCATTPIPASRAKPVPSDRLYAFQEMRENTTSTIVVTRDKGALGSGCYHLLTIDGTLAAKLDVGETAQFYVAPGEVFLRV
jgi:hypothetical protein